jgi:hypothetical protein
MCPFLEVPEGFTPEMLELLDRAFSDTWRELHLSGSPATCGENEQATRSVIAKSILDLAATGVREPGRLKRHALHAAKKAAPRTGTIAQVPD